MAKPNSRETFIDYCLRRLGHPVIEINIDEDQMDDRVDDALQLYYEYHADGSARLPFAIKITQTHLNNKYIDLNADDPTDNPGLAAFRNRIINVGKVFPLDDQTSEVNFFDIKYQMRLNDMFDLQTGIGELAYYEQMQQYLGLIDMKLTGHPQIAYNRRSGLLRIEGDLKDTNSTDIKVGEYIMAELYVRLGDAVNVWDDLFLKEYATALFKKQWGENISKFDGITLPGGITLNGRQLIDDANVDIEKARERLYNEYDTPPDFFVG